MPELSIVALIPARAGSKRVPGKNTRLLAGHPLIAYAIAAARASGIFADVIVSTDSPDTAAIAQRYGGDVPFLRPVEFAGDLSPDIEWIRHTLATLADRGRCYDCFAILRPTNPFRQPDTIRRAWAQFRSLNGSGYGAPGAVDSLRAVEHCRQHPGKMWVLRGACMEPLLRDGPTIPPWHSLPYQALPEVYAQNASLEIAWCQIIAATGTIAGSVVAPFFTEGFEGLDVNDAKDWWYAEYLVDRGEAALPAVGRQ